MIREVTWGIRKAYLASRRRYIILKRGGEKFLTRIPPGVKRKILAAIIFLGAIIRDEVYFIRCFKVCLFFSPGTIILYRIFY